MCTLLLLRHVHPEWPLLLAANRDERYDRPAEGPQVLASPPRIVGGRDVERRGTWMGVTEHGFFVGLTNQRGSANLMHSPYTRGEVVLRALQAGSQEGVEAYLAEEEDSPELREALRHYQALCIHTPGYGTRSSALVALKPGRVAHYLASDVAPCQGPFRDVTSLLSS